jgi:hypothetical protein
VSRPEPAPGDGDIRVGWLAVAVLAACGVLAGLIESLLVSLYIGRVIVPIAVVLALVSNIALPWLARNAVPRTSAAVAPFAGWLLVVVLFNGVARPEGDVIYPGGEGYLPWVSYGVILGGALAGAATIALTALPRPTDTAPLKTSVAKQAAATRFAARPARPAKPRPRKR